MLVSAAALLFTAGLLAAFRTLYVFEREVRRERVIRRSAVRRALRRLIGVGLAGGVGMGLLGMSAFLFGRSGPPGPSAYLWAGVFVLAAALGWPAILVSAFVMRVSALARMFPERDEPESTGNE